jgi:hypothetical protein
MKMINESHGKNHFTSELSLLGWFGEGKTINLLLQSRAIIFFSHPIYFVYIYIYICIYIVINHKPIIQIVINLLNFYQSSK